MSVKCHPFLCGLNWQTEAKFVELWDQYTPMDSSDWFIIISVVWAKQKSMHENHIRKGLGTNLLGNRPENLIIIRFVALWGLLP